MPNLYLPPAWERNPIRYSLARPRVWQVGRNFVKLSARGLATVILCHNFNCNFRTLCPRTGQTTWWSRQRETTSFAWVTSFLAENDKNSIILPREIENKCLDLKQLFPKLQRKQSWIKGNEYERTKLVACSRRSVSWSNKNTLVCVCQ